VNHKKVQVIVLTTTKPEKVLLLKTNKKRGGFWQNITGSVEREESFIEAAEREIAEEINLTEGEIVELDHSFIFTDRYQREVIERPLILLLEEVPASLELSEEHDDYRWIPIDDVQESHFEYESNYDAYVMAVKYWRERS